MTRKRILIVCLSALGTSLLLGALVLWGQVVLEEKLVAAREDLYLAYDWFPEPTIVPAPPTVSATPTATPSPTPTPQPQPPVRLSIPRIKVNSAIHEIGVISRGDPVNPQVVWPQLTSGVAHDQASANPGEAGNILLFGHNNTAGQVFRRLSELKAGDVIDVFTADRKYSYSVVEVDIVRAKGAREQDQQVHAFYLGPKSKETLTLVSCWPYVTYTHRVYVVAEPMGVTDQ